MGSGKDTFVAEPIQKIIYKMGEKASELYCNATFRMCMDNFQSSRAFRIGSKDCTACTCAEYIPKLHMSLYINKLKLDIVGRRAYRLC